MPLPPERPGLSMGRSSGGIGIDPKWIIGGLVSVAVLAWWLWNRSSNSANASNPSNSPNSLNVNANIAPVSSENQWPQGQLSLPYGNIDDINLQLLQAQQAQQQLFVTTPVNY